jgi:hypothetical protein
MLKYLKYSVQAQNIVFFKITAHNPSHILIRGNKNLNLLYKAGRVLAISSCQATPHLLKALSKYFQWL